MSTYSTDTELPEEPDDAGAYIFVSSSPVERKVRLDLSEDPDRGAECYMTPEYAERLAASLVRQAGQARRYDK